MVQEQNNTKINVKDWIILSTTMIGAVLTILALIWQFKPSYGIITVTFLLMLSFILFVNSVSANSKANFELKSKNLPEKQVFRFVAFAEYTFGLGFTLVMTAFSILGYKYFLRSTPVLSRYGVNQFKRQKRGDIFKSAPTMVAFWHIEWFDVCFGFGDYKTERQLNEG